MSCSRGQQKRFSKCESVRIFIVHKSSASNNICWFLKIFFFVVLELAVHVFVVRMLVMLEYCFLQYSTILNITSVSTGYQEQILLRNDTAASYYLKMNRLE